jgi:hypothetical protein
MSALAYTYRLCEIIKTSQCSPKGAVWKVETLPTSREGRGSIKPIEQVVGILYLLVNKVHLIGFTDVA